MVDWKSRSIDVGGTSYNQHKIRNSSKRRESDRRAIHRLEAHTDESI